MARRLTKADEKRIEWAEGMARSSGCSDEAEPLVTAYHLGIAEQVKAMMDGDNDAVLELMEGTMAAGLAAGRSVGGAKTSGEGRPP